MPVTPHRWAVMGSGMASCLANTGGADCPCHQTGQATADSQRNSRTGSPATASGIHQVSIHSVQRSGQRARTSLWRPATQPAANPLPGAGQCCRRSIQLRPGSRLRRRSSTPCWSTCSILRSDCSSPRCCSGCPCTVLRPARGSSTGRPGFQHYTLVSARQRLLEPHLRWRQFQ